MFCRASEAVAVFAGAFSPLEGRGSRVANYSSPREVTIMIILRKGLNSARWEISRFPGKLD